MKILSICLLFLFAPLGLQAQNATINGTWNLDLNGTPLTLELKSDGTGSLEGETFTWTTQDVYLITENEEGTAYYQYSLAQNTLTITDASGLALTFTKKQGNSTTASSTTKPATTTKSTTAVAASEKKPAASQVESKALLGHWKNEQAKLEIKSDGMMLVNGVQYKYEITSPGNLTITGNDGSVVIPYTLSGTKLTVTMNGQSAVYTKYTETANSTATKSGGNVSQEFVGKWCYMSNIYASNGGSMKNECFTLNADGTYSYQYESSSSNAYGSVASQDSDQGTWKVAGNQLHAHSNKGTNSVYNFEKKNHPKTGDPMMVLEGRAFVTAYNKAPWK